MALTEQMTELRDTLAAAHRVAFEMPMGAQTDQLLAFLQSALDIIGDEPAADPHPADPPELDDHWRPAYADREDDYRIDDVPF